MNRFVFKQKKYKEKVDFKHKFDLMWPSMTFKVILNIIKNMRTHNVSIQNKFQ